MVLYVSDLTQANVCCVTGEYPLFILFAIGVTDRIISTHLNYMQVQIL